MTSTKLLTVLMATTTYHADGSVTTWDLIRGQWVTGTPDADVLATMSTDEREKVIAHCATRRVEADLDEDCF